MVSGNAQLFLKTNYPEKTVFPEDIQGNVELCKYFDFNSELSECESSRKIRITHQRFYNLFESQNEKSILLFSHYNQFV